jgi:poly(A) polymerase
MGRTADLGRDGGDARQPVGAAAMVMLDRPGLDTLIVALGGATNARIIGGAVRDTLLGLPVSDIDIATRLTPEVVTERLDAADIKAIPTGLAHGTVTAVTEGGPVEITTLRRDVSTDGRHATVAFTDDWREDAARRDFTINALAADPETGEVFDYFGGLDDLKAGTVRFIGEPLQRIAEDHLRILRFFRFHARFGKGGPDSAALEACTARANDLMALSRERIASELLKILATHAPHETVALMLRHGILAPVLPEIAHADVLARLVAREAIFKIDANPVRRLAALIGPDAGLAREIALRLKFSNAQTRRMIRACSVSDDMPVPALAYRLGIDEARDRLLLTAGTASDFATLDAWTRPVFPLKGGALIARGLTPGPTVASALKSIENQWIDAAFPSGPAFEDIVSHALPQETSSQI